MRINELRIENMKGIECLEMTEIPDTVVIAGPNGCGKSSVLDCIRLVKSLHAGYEPNEANLLATEMGVNRKEGLRGVLRRADQVGKIEAIVELTKEESRFLLGNTGIEAIRETAWRLKFPQQDMWQLRWSGIRTPEMLQAGPEIEEEVTKLQQLIRQELETGPIVAGVRINSDGTVGITGSATLRVVWGSFLPGRVGVIDFHGSQRMYGREGLTQITLNEDEEENRWRSGSLYNYSSKYSNVKNAMAGEYIRAILAARESGQEADQRMINEMSRLINEFLKGKSFEGPQVTNGKQITFPVKTADGAVHDIDDLSAGEKEVVFGYLRAKTQTPNNSIIMIDEPELHLNPGLMRGLGRFYQEGIGGKHRNQLWLVSHSDAFLKDAVRTEGMKVYHMDAARGEGTNQLQAVETEEELDRLVIEIVGDLAQLRAHGPILVVEGKSGGTDAWIVEQLFGDLTEKVTIVAAEGRTDVEKTQELLRRIEATRKPSREVYAICDRDDPKGLARTRKQNQQGRVLTWDRYHIENYLLEPAILAAACENIARESNKALEAEGIEKALKQIAEEHAERFARTSVEAQIRGELHEATRFGRRKDDEASQAQVAEELHRSLQNVMKQVQKLASTTGQVSEIEGQMAKRAQELRRSLHNGKWKAEFRGRDILGTFVQRYLPGINRERFITLVVKEMQRMNHRPRGMERVLKMILSGGPSRTRGGERSSQ